MQNIRTKRRISDGRSNLFYILQVHLRSLENNEVYYLLIKHNVTGYFRYVDVVLIRYDTSKSNIHYILDDFNKLAPKLKFTLEEEINHEINCLDITIQ
jgi:hypothetical protein